MQDAYRGGDSEAYSRGGDGGPINTIYISTDNKTLNVLHTYKEPMQDAYRGGDRDAYRGGDREAYRGGDSEPYSGSDGGPINTV